METNDRQPDLFAVTDALRNLTSLKLVQTFQDANRIAEMMSIISQDDYWSIFQQNLNAICQFSESFYNLGRCLTQTAFLEDIDVSLHIIQEVKPTLLNWMNHLERVQEMPSPEDSPVEVSADTLEMLRELSPLIPENDREEFDEIISPEKNKERKILTTENIKWLIALILSIVMPLLVHYLDSKPSESEIASIQLQEEFLDKFQELIDAIELQNDQSVKFIDEPGILRNQFQSSVDLVTPDIQDDGAPNQDSVQEENP